MSTSLALLPKNYANEVAITIEYYLGHQYCQSFLEPGSIK